MDDPESAVDAAHEPALFARAATICEYQDFMTLRLTGRRAASLDNVSIRWHYASERGGWPTSLLGKLGLEDLQGKWPQKYWRPAR